MKIQRDAHLYNLSLAKEHDNYNLVQGCCHHLPMVIDHGQDGPWTFLVVEDLGMDLGKLYRVCGSLGFYFISQLVSGMILRLAEIHRAGFIHADVKPGNFIARRRNAQISLIDLETLECCPAPAGALRGTPLWASHHSLRGEALSFRDDMHSLAYCLIYFIRGSLPWMEEDSMDVENLARIKAETSVDELCQNIPRPSVHFVKHCFSLTFSCTPDYSYLRKCTLALYSL